MLREQAAEHLVDALRGAAFAPLQVPQHIAWMPEYASALQGWPGNHRGEQFERRFASGAAQ
jgi:hypothetical protein